MVVPNNGALARACPSPAKQTAVVHWPSFGWQTRGRKSYNLRQELSGPRQVGRLIRTSSNRLWAEVGAIGLDQETIQGNPASDGAKGVQTFIRERDHSGEGDVQSKLEELLGIIQGSREGMEDATDGLLPLLELLDEISLAITAVDDDGQVKLAGEPQMEIEPLLLLSKRSMVPVAVQAGLTDGGHPAMLLPAPRSGASRLAWASATWLGWTPTAAKTPGWPAAISITRALSSAVVPTAII